MSNHFDQQICAQLNTHAASVLKRPARTVLPGPEQLSRWSTMAVLCEIVRRMREGDSSWATRHRQALAAECHRRALPETAQWVATYTPPDLPADTPTDRDQIAADHKRFIAGIGAIARADQHLGECDTHRETSPYSAAEQLRDQQHNQLPLGLFRQLIYTTQRASRCVGKLPASIDDVANTAEHLPSYRPAHRM